MIDVNKCYRPDEVAKILSVSVRQIYRFVDDPTDPLGAIKLSNSKKGKIRIPGEDLKSWIDKRQIEPWE